jgi:peptidyl-prolyl cis-trans isomerase D
MFIAHGERLRKYAPWILAGVLLLLLPGFVLLFSPSPEVRRRDEPQPTIAGKPINPAELQHARRAVIAQFLIATGRTLPATARIEEQLQQDAVLRVLLLRKARELGIRVSDEELVQHLRSLPAFRTQDGRFDPELYRQFMIRLGHHGISEALFEQIMREQIILERLQALIGAAAKVTPLEVELTLGALHERMIVETVEFNVADHTEPLHITDEEARAFYEQNPETFRTPARLKVRYVLFSTEEAKKSVTVTDEDVAEYYQRTAARSPDARTEPKPLETVREEIRNELLQLRAERLAADRATEFSVRLVFEEGAPRPDFAALAAEFGVSTTETDFFDVQTPVPGVRAGLQFNQTAFTLSPRIPFSDPVRGEDGYYVLEYLDSRPSELPPFEQVKDRAIERVKTRRIYEATLAKGRETLARLKQTMAAGKTFAEACAQLGLSPRSTEPFTAAEPPEALPAAAIGELAVGMPAGAVSEFIPTPTGGVFFHLKERLPPQPEKLAEEKARLEQQLLQRNRQALFHDWLAALVREQRVDFGLRPRPATPAPEPEPEPVLPLPPAG